MLSLRRWSLHPPLLSEMNIVPKTSGSPMAQQVKNSMQMAASVSHAGVIVLLPVTSLAGQSRVEC